MIRRDTLLDAASTIVRLTSHYKGAPHREMRVDGLVYGFLHAKFGVDRQYRVKRKGKEKPDRIDFHQPGKNPVVIEFAVRTASHRNEVYGSGNTDELRKLAKLGKMKGRYLLLLDLSGAAPISRDALRKSYDKINAGRGRFARASVRVLYVHPKTRYHFLWRPAV